MSTKQDQGSIWPSYADLMTSLFGVALVLFVLSYWLLTVKYKLSAEKWQEIQKIEESVLKLADKEYFRYEKEYKRHVLLREVHFEVGKATIPDADRTYLKSAGERIFKLIDEFGRKPSANIKYLIIIEGMASSDGYANNFALSYQRALALYRLWQELGITFDSNVAEIIVAGSGEAGVGRYSGVDESKNQRFLIQILPKVGAEGFETVSPITQAASR